MEGDHAQPSARAEQAGKVAQRLLKRGQLVVDRDAQRLKGTPGGVGGVLLAKLLRDGRVDDLDQLPGGFDGMRLPPVAQHARDLHRPVFLAVVANDPCDFLLAPVVDDRARGKRLALIHAHVQRRVGVIGEAAAALVQLMTGHAQIEQRPVDGKDVLRREQRLYVVKIAPERTKTRPSLARKERHAARRRLDGILIPVDAKETAAGAKPLVNLAGMSGAAQRAVDVGAILADGQSVQALVKQHRQMMKLHVFSRQQTICTAPSGRILSGVTAPSPNTAFIVRVYSSSILAGTKASMVPAKPPPWMRHAPLP